MTTNRPTKSQLLEYLLDKHLNSTLVRVVEAVLTERPDEPISFMAQYLLDEYPEETRGLKWDRATACSSGCGGSTSSSSSSSISSDLVLSVSSGGISGTCSPVSSEETEGGAVVEGDKDRGEDDGIATMAIEAETMSSEEEEDGINNDVGEKLLPPTAPTATDDDDANNAMDISAESDGDDEEDGTDDDDEGKPKDAAAPRRRTSIAAESLDLTKLSASIKVVPKTDEEAERILQILQQNVLFRHMDKEQLNKVQGAMRLVEKEEADTIIKQGDDGDFFYIVDTGEVDVYIKTPSGENDDAVVGANEQMSEPETESEQQLVASYGEGGAFGELAIMYNAPRAASCIARTDVRLWALDRISFKILAMQTALARRDEYQGFLEEVPLLASLSNYEKLTLADALEEQAFEDGAVICEEGKAGDKFYIIKSGRAICTSSDGTTIGRLGKGDYYGEIALLTEKKRQCTVKAAGEEGLTCLSLDRKAFGRCIGPLESVLRRNMESY